MINTTLISDGKSIGVNIDHNGKSLKVIFNKHGKVGGTVFAGDDQKKAITL